MKEVEKHKYPVNAKVSVEMRSPHKDRESKQREKTCTVYATKSASIILVAVIGVKERSVSTSAGSRKRWIIVTGSSLISCGAHPNLDGQR